MTWKRSPVYDYVLAPRSESVRAHRAIVTVTRII